MKKVFYIKTRKIQDKDRKNLKLDKIGGLPTHKPVEYPIYPTGKKAGFLMQIYYDEMKFPIKKDILCWQFYQHPEEGGIDFIVEVPLDAELNVDKEGCISKGIQEYVIEYSQGEEPDLWEVDNCDIDYSKIGGAIPYGYENSKWCYIGTLHEDICEEFELNLGDISIELYLDEKGEMHYTI